MAEGVDYEPAGKVEVLREHRFSMHSLHIRTCRHVAYVFA